MSAFWTFVLKFLPTLSTLIPVIMSLFNHQAAMSRGLSATSAEYLTYVGGVGAGGGLAAFLAASGIQVWGLNALKNGMIGFRLRQAAGLNEGSSEKEIERACDKLK